MSTQKRPSLVAPGSGRKNQPPMTRIEIMRKIRGRRGSIYFFERLLSYSVFDEKGDKVRTHPLKEWNGPNLIEIERLPSTEDTLQIVETYFKWLYRKACDLDCLPTKR